MGGTVQGDPDLLITGIRPFEEAREGEITLAVERRYLRRLSATRASAVIVAAGVGSQEKCLIQVDRPKVAFARILQLFSEKPFNCLGISSRAVIGRDCSIPENVTIHPFVWIGDHVTLGEGVTLHPGVRIGNGCRLGRDCTLHSNVSLYNGVQLGSRVILHSGSVIGADGFGYVRDGEEQVKVVQRGDVRIGDDVEIGANSCVDRATFGSTVIESGVKLDNLVHVGHNCRIGRNSVIVGCVGISGSVEIGANCILAGQAGVIDHIKIGDNVTVMVKTAVTKDIPSNSVVSGQPAIDHRQELKLQASLRRLPRLLDEWKELKSRMETLLSGDKANDD